MKQSAGKMFVGSFLKSLMLVMFLFGTGVLSYQIVMHFWKDPFAGTIVPFEIQPEAKSITEASIDAVSKNLIFCVNEDTSEISKILLEIFHCEDKKLYYITIPVRTQFTMSDTLYQKLILVHPAVPQVIKFTSITKYFDLDTRYDYGVLLMEDLLGMDISYYTAAGQGVYETMFTTEELSSKVAGSKEDSSTTEKGTVTETIKQTARKEIFSKEYITFLKTLETAEDVSKYIEDSYPSVQSNLSLFGKMNYFESYCNTPRGNVFFELISGTDKNSAYVIDTALATRQIEKCMGITEN